MNLLDVIARIVLLVVALAWLLSLMADVLTLTGSTP